MRKVWQRSSILHFEGGVTFSMLSGAWTQIRRLPDHSDLRNVGHVLFRVLKVATTHHNFVHWPVIWVQPKVDASLKGHNSRESA
jgi:hypothetical protein